MDVYLCFGADSGARAETLLRAASQAAVALDAKSIACSSLYADRYRTGSLGGGALVNMAVALGNVSLSVEEGKATIARIEAHYGRVRDAERPLPVPIDIDWIGHADEHRIAWEPRYDRGRSYLWQGLQELGDETIRPDLDAVAIERGFTAEENGRAHYPLLSAAFARRLLWCAVHEF